MLKHCMIHGIDTMGKRFVEVKKESLADLKPRPTPIAFASL